MPARQRINKVIGIIEEDLETPFTTEELAKQVHWSRWQLQRTFLVSCGYSLAQYGRCRRLSKAACSLVQSRQPIIEIAMTCGFDNQQSFSKAFTQLFNCTPKQYRLSGTLTDLFPRLEPELCNLTYEERIMEPKIQISPAKKIMGLTTRFNAIGSPKPDNMELLPRLWHSLQNQIEKNKINSSVYWGVVDTSTANDQLEGVTYWAGVEEDQGRKSTGLSHCHIPEQTYACFTHKGPLNSLPDTINAIFQWLPDSGYRHSGGPDLELYDERFAFDHPESVLEYWVPVEKEIN